MLRSLTKSLFSCSPCYFSTRRYYRLSELLWMRSIFSRNTLLSNTAICYTWMSCNKREQFIALGIAARWSFLSVQYSTVGLLVCQNQHLIHFQLIWLWKSQWRSSRTWASLLTSKSSTSFASSCGYRSQKLVVLNLWTLLFIHLQQSVKTHMKRLQLSSRPAHVIELRAQQERRQPASLQSALWKQWLPSLMCQRSQTGNTMGHKHSSFLC